MYGHILPVNRERMRMKSCLFSMWRIRAAAFFAGGWGKAITVALNITGGGVTALGFFGPKDEIFSEQIKIKLTLACECDEAEVPVAGYPITIKDKAWFPKRDSLSFEK